MREARKLKVKGSVNELLTLVGKVLKYCLKKSLESKSLNAQEMYSVLPWKKGEKNVVNEK